MEITCLGSQSLFPSFGGTAGLTNIHKTMFRHEEALQPGGMEKHDLLRKSTARPLYREEKTFRVKLAVTTLDE